MPALLFDSPNFFSQNTNSVLNASYGTIINFLHNSGLPRTDDLGQLDLSTAVPAQNALMGYTIHQFSDSIQSTLPIFIKFFWRGSNHSPVRWIVDVQVGAETNGAGSFVGTSSPSIRITDGAQPYESGHVLSCDTNRLFMYLCPRVSFSATAHLFYIERVRNSEGEPSDLGVFYGSSNGSNHGFISPNLTLVNFVTIPSIKPPVSAVNNFGTDVFCYPIFPTRGGRIFNPLIGILTTTTSGWISREVYNITDPYGVVRPYLHQYSDGIMGYARNSGNQVGLMALWT
jgi:hypothetical protein